MMNKEEKHRSDYDLTEQASTTTTPSYLLGGDDEAAVVRTVDGESVGGAHIGVTLLQGHAGEGHVAVHLELELGGALGPTSVEEHVREEEEEPLLISPTGELLQTTLSDKVLQGKH